MLLLADRTAGMIELAEHFSHRPTDWTVAATGTLPVDARCLWRTIGQRHDPYRLAAVRELPFWSRLLVIDTAADSQFDQLRSVFNRPRRGTAAPACEPVACVALTGHGCHGQRGRPWCAVRGNLHLSLAFATELPTARFGLAMTMLPAVAVVDFLRASETGAAAAGIKWVNDILVAGRKIAGVLTVIQSRGDRLATVLLGIGLNVQVTPAVEPTVFVPEVTCLREVGGGDGPSLPVALEGVLRAVARRLDELHRHGPDRLLQAYREASLVIGRRVRIWDEGLAGVALAADLPPARIIGTVRAIDRNLALTIDGHAEPVGQGRLAFDAVCRA